MGVEQRAGIIREIENLTSSRLICYVTGDRRGLETKIAGDILPLVYDHLRAIGCVSRLNIFLYTVGGDPLAGWALVSLIREFSQAFGVIIPFRALSCGTLISLGADELILSRGAQLSPVDPSLASPYNPQVPGQMQPGAVPSILPVSVEDVVGYLKLARDEAGIKGDEGISNIMVVLSQKVHPMALGAVYRSREQIRLLATKLLAAHENDEAKISKIVDTLTKELPSHQYLINRREAKELGLKVSEPSVQLDELIYNLYRDYETQLQLNIPYNQEAILGTAESGTNTFDRAFIESLTPEHRIRAHVFRTTREIKRIQTTQPGIPFPIAAFQERNLEERWIEIQGG